MDAYQVIENLMAKKYGRDTTTRKAVGDFMLAEDHAVNVKSNNVDKQNYSPNMLSIKRMHKWVFEDRNKLSFIFVDYKVVDGEIEILNETDLIPIEHIDWACLSIEAQGYGAIQKVGPLAIDTSQTKRDFYVGFLEAYEKYKQKEHKKHETFARRLITDLDSIDW